jgi:hypothetical protein
MGVHPRASRMGMELHEKLACNPAGQSRASAGEFASG